MEFSQELWDKSEVIVREIERKKLRNREQRVRRQAKRYGWLLQKSDPPRQSRTDAEEQGYRLFDPRQNMAVVGAEFDASLSIIEVLFRRAPKEEGAK